MGNEIKDKLAVREASSKDIPDILEIYKPYVLDTTATFECELPSSDEFLQRMRQIQERYPFLICELSGQTVAFAYADAYMNRKAYDWSAEASVYVAQDKQGCGIGEFLYGKLTAMLKEMGIQSVYAAITAENESSIGFHEKCGFKSFATFSKAGYKFDRWLDVTWMELTLGEHEQEPKPVKWMPSLRIENVIKILRSR